MTKRSPDPAREFGSSRHARGARRVLRRLAAACLLACGVLAQSVCAQSRTASLPSQGPLQLSVGTAVAWDDNVFRLSDSVDTQALLGTSSKADRYVSAFAGVHLDKPYAQQRFRLDATETAYRYDRFSFLDSNNFQYAGAWDWHFTPRLSGTLSADRSEALANYGDYRTPIRNIVTVQNRSFSVDAQVSGGLHLLAGASHNESDNSVTFVQQASYSGNGAEAGVAYFTESRNSVKLTTRTFRADYVDQPLDPVNLLDSGYRRRENELAVAWMPSGKSTLTGTATRIDYGSANFAARDFSGTAGALVYQWRPTDKLTLGLSAGRTLLPYIDNFSTYVASDIATVAPTWQISPRLRLRASLSRSVSDFRGAVVPLAGPARHDDLDAAQIALDWTPRRALTLGASLRHEKRSSNTADFDYRDNFASFSATISF